MFTVKALLRSLAVPAALGLAYVRLGGMGTRHVRLEDTRTAKSEDADTTANYLGVGLVRWPLF